MTNYQLIIALLHEYAFCFLLESVKCNVWINSSQITQAWIFSLLDAQYGKLLKHKASVL